MSHTADKSRGFQALIGAPIAIGLLFVGLTPAARSQKSSIGNSGPDISGIWDLPGAASNPSFVGVEGRGSSFLKRPEEPTLTPWGEEQYKKNRQKGAWNPATYCYPLGPSRTMTGPGHRTFEVRQHSDAVFIMFERDHWIRRIYTDGRQHPEGYPITWMGHTIGKWDGDTLVADTVYINPMSWVDNFGHPMSDRLHMVERIRRTDPKHLQIDTTFEDPKVYTRPWIERKTFELMPAGYEIMEDVECESSLGKIKHVTEEEDQYDK